MPEISRFYGIIITMYYEFGRHQQPHFHARSEKYRASFTITPPALLAGTMPRRQHNLILAWAELHQEELMENWRRVEQEQTLLTIEGL
ncbi:MAG: DUF4160 domain-containing protein [Anaerolineae bacterium]|nr:DUF4160 domain-containing protein [Anaerolineae bacterium]